MSTKTAAILSSMLLAACMSTAAQAKLYKWVDSEGNVHYSDKVPPQYADQEREVKSERTGSTVERVAAPKTKEEVAAEEERRRREAALKAAEQAQAEQDRVLLMTFSSVDEMERVRDERIASLEGQIELTAARLRKLEEQLEREQQRAARLERNGQSPEAAYGRISKIETQIEENTQFIADTRNEQQAIRERFDRDIERYRQLQTEQAERAKNR